MEKTNQPQKTPTPPQIHTTTFPKTLSSKKMQNKQQTINSSPTLPAMYNFHGPQLLVQVNFGLRNPKDSTTFRDST